MPNKLPSYERLKRELELKHKWPSDYMYKFIIPTNDNELSQIKEVFQTAQTFRSTLSKTGKYTSITVIAYMKNPTEVIDKYKELEHIKTIISL